MKAIKKIQDKLNLHGSDDVKRKFAKAFVDPRRGEFMTAKFLTANLAPSVIMGGAAATFLSLSPLYIATLAGCAGTSVLGLKNKKRIEGWAKLPEKKSIPTK